ncbi:MAG TPA: hypothetical protein VED18_08625 [Candidatus Sulfotelmatobacter sp.]|nr:hypothetical protein [Candidatus Sulfotelmatobacter sp.]
MPGELKPAWAEFENLDGVIYSQVTVRDEWIEVSGRRIPWPRIVGLRLLGQASAGPGSAMDPMLEIFTADGEVVPVLARVHLAIESRAAHEAAAGHDQPAAQVAAAVRRLAPNLSPVFAAWTGWRVPVAASAGAAAAAVLAALAHGSAPVVAVSAVVAAGLSAMAGQRWDRAARREHATRALPGCRP